MTDNIQKLYETAGVGKLGIKRCSGVKQTICQHNCDECKDYVLIYPPFTAEKQLELIKWLLRQHRFSIQYAFVDSEYGLLWSEDELHESWHKDFSQALAGLITNLYQDLTNNQKQEIKRILQ